MKRVLHVGSGGESLPTWLGAAEQTSLDIDPAHEPDIVADMRAIGDIGHYDMVLCSHALEHLYPHEVHAVLVRFRELADGSLIVVPDLEGVAADDTVLFDSPAGPIAGLDLIYGHRMQIPGNPHMAHHCGFTAATLEAAMRKAGFAEVKTVRAGWCHNLYGIGRA